jgi:hypothetical protein
MRLMRIYLLLNNQIISAEKAQELSGLSSDDWYEWKISQWKQALDLVK